MIDMPTLESSGAAAQLVGSGGAVEEAAMLRARAA